jgi:hypothetical protein
MCFVPPSPIQTQHSAPTAPEYRVNGVRMNLSHDCKVRNRISAFICRPFWMNLNPNPFRENFARLMQSTEHPILTAKMILHCHHRTVTRTRTTKEAINRFHSVHQGVMYIIPLF